MTILSLEFKSIQIMPAIAMAIQHGVQRFAVFAVADIHGGNGGWVIYFDMCEHSAVKIIAQMFHVEIRETI